MACRNLLLLCFFVAGSTVPAAFAQSNGSPITLDDARTILKSPDSAKRVGNIDLAAFNFSREVEIGGGIRVIVISTNHEGGLAAFREDGTLIQTLKTDEITWLQLFDLNEDGISEIVTEEVNGWGTGVLRKSFNLYIFSRSAIKKAWQADSYILEAVPKRATDAPTVNIRTGYVRFDASGFGEPAKMTYVLLLPPMRVIEQKVFVMHGEKILQIPIEASRR